MSAEPVSMIGPKNQSVGVELVPLSKIHVNHEWFQNRATPYSARSVNNIIDAVRSGSFVWANMDAITLWPGPGGKLFILSWHSRTEAFRQLCETGVKIEGKDFCKIPAKIAEGLSLEEAKRLATESNTLSTQETPIERSLFYRKMRNEGAGLKEITDRANRLEGRNANTVVAYSFLNPSGKTYSTLAAMENGQIDSANVIGQVARWIGNARKKYSELTDRHENEIFDWLVTSGGYGRSKGQVNSERQFMERLGSIINRRTQNGELKSSLNITNAITKSPTEQQHDLRIEEAKRTEQVLQRELAAKTKELVARGATDQELQRILEPLERQLRRQRAEIINLRQKRDEVSQAARNELSLFASVGRIRIRI